MAFSGCAGRDRGIIIPHKRGIDEDLTIRLAARHLFGVCNRGGTMATVKLFSDAEAAKIPAVKAVFDDIRTTRKSDFVNMFWRALANDPANLVRVWQQVK